MSRVSKWKLEKTKVKVVFRLQFHATHIPQSGWEKLFISFIPADTGKATAKTNKANVRNGTCKWSDPIYETTRLLQDSTSKLYDEKLYKIVVAMGSSRASILGEATINLADYVDALKPCDVALTLLGSNFGTILHVTIQLLTSKTGFREFEQQRELREKGFHSGVDSHATEDVTIDHIDKVSARIKFKSEANELSSLEEEANPNEEYSGSATGFDGSSNTSGSFSAEASRCQSPHKVKRDISDHPNTAQGSISSDKSTDNNELAMAFEENNLLRTSLELAESSFFNLKLEVDSLQNLAEELGSETQKLSRQLANEVSSSEQLAKEVSVLKSECLNFKDEISRIKYSKIPVIETFESDDRLVSENGLGLDLCQPEIILQHFNMNNAPLSEPIDAMKAQIFDLVRELDDAKIEKESLTRKMDQMECYYEALIHELEENQKRIIGELQLVTNEHSTCFYTLSLSKSETEKLSQDMSQQMLRFIEEKRDLEAINEELEKRATTSEAALKRARLNYSIAVDKLQKDLELLSSQVMSVFETNESLIKQALPFENREVNDSKNLQLKRAEEELMEVYSMNLNLDIYSKALQQPLIDADSEIRNMKEKIDELVEELKLSTASQNELMVRLQKATDDIHELNEDKYSSISQNRILEDKFESISMVNYLLDQKVKDSESTVMACLAENAEISLQLKKEAFENEKLRDEVLLLEEKITALKVESDELNFVRDKLRDLLASQDKQLSFSANDRDILDLESVAIKDAILQLEEMQNNASVKYSQLMEENQSLKSERAVADVAMKHEAIENEKLTDEVSLLNEKITALKVESDELASSKENLEETINFVKDKLRDLLASYNNQFSFSDNNCHITDLESVGIKDAILQLEEIQNNASVKYSQLMEENQNLKSERAVADVAMSTARSEILTVKHNFRKGMQEMANKLDYSNALVDKLQSEFDSVTDKIRLGSEMEENYFERNKVLLSDFARLEDQMQELTCNNNGHLAREISGLDSLAEELVRRNLTINELLHDKQELALCLQNKTEESNKLLCEVSCLNENLKVLHDELNEEKACKDEMERKIRDLTFNLFNFEQQKAELMLVKELASDLELEKSRLLGEQNLFVERNISDRASYESQLLEMHEYSLAADVKLTYLANRYETLIEELVQKHLSSEESAKDLQTRFLDTEVNWTEEKTNLLTSIETLRSELEASEAQNKLLLCSNVEFGDKLDECNKKLKTMETRFSVMEEEISGLTVLKEELEILVILLKDKVDEQFGIIASLEEHKDELSHKLSEQILKTEELENLSLTSREKREPEVQDSLRIAFIKEQCESQIQELKQQLLMSKKHGEEMLLKLQDAIDEIENRKKSEAVSLKKNDELSLRLSALESELRGAISEKREKSNGYDRAKAELECALLSLECCKEEKEKLVASLREFDEEKSRLADELSLVKGQLEILESSVNSENEVKREKMISIVDGENANSDEFAQDSLHVGMHPISEELVTEESSHSNGNNLDIKNEHLGARQLRFSIEHLHEELEKMKNENTVFNTGHDVGPEISQLQKANEELRNMFPLFDEISSGGNALQRVLALEIELAEALKTKSKSNLQFQSSFLKQHSDEEAVLKSFRDINELIKEMLELKGRNADVEAELREMHNRFSQLSLQFAEVEGERQKLKMTLKNVRTSKKITLNRSSSANIVDNTS